MLLKGTLPLQAFNKGETAPPLSSSTEHSKLQFNSRKLSTLDSVWVSLNVYDEDKARRKTFKMKKSYVVKKFHNWVIKQWQLFIGERKNFSGSEQWWKIQRVELLHRAGFSLDRSLERTEENSRSCVSTPSCFNVCFNRKLFKIS